MVPINQSQKKVWGPVIDVYPATPPSPHLQRGTVNRYTIYTTISYLQYILQYPTIQPK